MLCPSICSNFLITRVMHFAYSKIRRRLTSQNFSVSSKDVQDCLLVGCLTSQQHASVSQRRSCSDNCKCCRTETEVADPTFHLTQSQYTDTGPTSPSIGPITPGAWQGRHWSADFLSLWCDSTQKSPVASGIGTADLPFPRRTP